MRNPVCRPLVLLLAGLPLVACTAEPAGPAPDLVLTGGRVLSARGALESGTVAIRSGRILAVGADDDLAALRARAARTFDLDGTTVGPAWVDHHVHLLNLGLSLVNREREQAIYAELGGLDLDRLAATLRERVAAGSEGDDGWLLGKGWSQGNWGSQTLPDREALDSATGDRPALLGRVDGHAAWVNSTGLEAAGIDAATPDPVGGRIERRPDGSPTGVLLERAAEAALARIGRPDDATLGAAFRAATAALAAQGVVEVYDAGFLKPPGIVDLGDDLAVYLAALVAADRTAPLPIRVNLMVPALTTLADAVLEDPDSYRRLSPRVGVTHLKLFADGALGSRGGWLDHPYADDPSTHGVPRMSAEEIRGWSERALDAGLDVATHAIGNAAVATVLDVYEELLGERPDLEARRLRIEHLSYARAADLERAAELGVVLSIQPNFVFPDDAGVAMEDSRLGKERTATVYAWGTLQRAGGALAFGSDYFTFPFAPLFTLHAASSRSNFDGLPAEGWHPDQRLDREAALEILTTLHRPGGEPPHRHRIAAGEAADLVVLDADPTSAGDLLAIEVLATLVGGRAVHAAGPLAALGSAATVDPAER